VERAVSLAARAAAPARDGSGPGGQAQVGV